MHAFALVGVPYAAGLMNLLVISAALSSAYSNLYVTTRMLFSLSRSGYARRSLSEVTAADPSLASSGIVALTGIAVTTFFVDGLQYTVPSFVPLLAVVSIPHARLRRRVGAPA